MPHRCVILRNFIVSGVYSTKKPNLIVLTLSDTFTLFLGHVTAVITVKTHSPVIWKYKMSNRCLLWRNFIVSGVYSTKKTNLIVLTLNDNFTLFLRHVTAVITVKTHSSVTWMYKMSNRCVLLRNFIVSGVYSTKKTNLIVLTLNNTFLASRDSCYNFRNRFTNDLNL